MNKFQVTLWTDEMVFARSAIQRQFDDYCKAWRDCFIKYDRSVAMVYITGIKALQSVMEEFDRVMPPK